MPELANPTVALGVNVPQPSGLANPLGLIGTIANAKRAMVEAQTASQSLAAREAAGQIIAQSPSLEAAESNLQKNPLTAGFALDMVNSLATLKQTQVGTQGLVQDQTLTGLQKVFQMIGSGVNDPVSGLKNARAIVGSLSPSAQPEASKALDAIEESLAGGMQKIQGATPEETQSMRKAYAAQQMAALATATGATSPEAVRAQTGSVAPSISLPPVGPEGQPEPVVTGGAMTQPPSASIVGAPGAPVQGISPEQSAELTGKGTVSADLARDMSETAANVPRDVQKVNALQDSMAKFQSGGGSAFRTQIGQSLQALKNAGFTGISQGTIDKVANGSLRGSEFFNSIIKPQMVSLIADVQRGSGVKSTANELNSYLDALDIDTDPGTINDFLNLLKKNLQFAYDRSQRYSDFVQERAEGKHNVPDYLFNQYYNKHFGSALPTETGGGVEIGPRSDVAVKGATSSSSSTSNAPKNLNDLKKLFGVTQ